MDLKLNHSTIIVTIKEQHSQLSNQNKAKYLVPIRIFLGQIFRDIKMEMGIHLCFHWEMILILLNLNAWTNQMKFVTMQVIWVRLDKMQVDLEYTTTATSIQIVVLD